MERTPKFIHSEDAKERLLNENRNVLLTTKETSGDIYLVEGIMPEGSEVPLHVHTLEDEIFHVLQGTVELRLGDQKLQASQGDIIYLPRAIPHSIKTVGTGTARVLNYVIPGENFEQFFNEMNSLATNVSAQERAELAEKFGIQFL